MTRQKSSSSALAVGSRPVQGLICRLCALLLFVTMAGGITVAHVQESSAQQAPAQQDGQVYSFGIVDMSAVMQQSNAIKVIRQALDEQNVLFQEQISEQELELRLAEKKLNEDKDTISKAEFDRRLADFEDRVISLQRRIQAQKSSFDRSFNEAQERLQQEIVKVISDIAAERGYAIIIQKQNAVIYDGNLDITALALERLNERTKNLKITLEKKE